MRLANRSSNCVQAVIAFHLLQGRYHDVGKIEVSILLVDVSACREVLIAEEIH